MASGYQRDRGQYNTAVSVPRLYWPAMTLNDSRVELTGDDAHRLRQVLRVTTGDTVALFDGRGHEWIGTIGSVTKQGVEVRSLESITPVAEARVPVTLAFGVLKGDQMDAVVRDATMLGVAALIPLRTEHVTVTTRAW